VIVDAQLQLASAQTLSASGASNNIVDLGAFQNRNITDGEGMAVFFNLPTAPASGGTYQIQLQAADDTAFSVNLTTLSTITLQSTDLVAGKKGLIAIPALTTIQRYVRLNLTLGGTSPSITFNAYIEPIHFVDRVRTYKDNSPIQ
jgi:hypothetical protein